MNLCKDCRHFNNIAATTAVCDLTKRKDPVFGSDVWDPCYLARRAGEVCGPDALKFEQLEKPKQPTES